jgi:hypothetical protein
VSPRAGDLEIRYRWVSATVVVLFGGAFAVGLILYFLDKNSAAALRTLEIGLLLLMFSPAVRIIVATAERLRRRDWAFLAMTAVVVMELGIVLWRAANR